MIAYCVLYERSLRKGDIPRALSRRVRGGVRILLRNEYHQSLDEYFFETLTEQITSNCEKSLSGIGFIHDICPAEK